MSDTVPLPDRIASARDALARLADLAPALHPAIYDRDAGAPEAPSRGQPSSRPLFVPEHASALYRAYIDACRHAVRSGQALKAVVDGPYWYTDLLGRANPAAPNPWVVAAGCRVNRDALGRVDPEKVTATEAAAVRHACDEAEAAWRTIPEDIRRQRRVDIAPPCRHCARRAPESGRKWCRACRGRHERGSCKVCGYGQAA